MSSASTDPALPSPEWIDVEDLRIRYARSPHSDPHTPTLVLLSPWPESIFAYDSMWKELTGDFSVIAIDLPGFGQSQSRADLMGPAAMGAFIIQILDALDLEGPHVVGPDIGTSALLFAAAQSPQSFASIQIGGGASAFPLKTLGLLSDFINSPDLDAFRAADPAQLIEGAVRSIPGYEVPDYVVADYVASYTGTRFVDSIAYVRSYPTDLADLAVLLPSIQTPVHIIASRNDPLLELADPEALQEALPNSRLSIVDNFHNAWEESPVEYASLVAEWANEQTAR